MLLNWVTDIRQQCIDANVAFFFKQWGGVQKKRNGRELEGRTWDQMPGDNVRSAALSLMNGIKENDKRTARDYLRAFS